MVKSVPTTASSVAAIIFLAACTPDVLVQQALGASYDLQVHTCADVSEWLTIGANGGVAAEFCTEEQECVTSLLAGPLSNGGSITDTFEPDSDYTFTLSIGPGVSTMELTITSTNGWCFDQLSLGPSGGTLEQLQTTSVFIDNPCQADEDFYYEGIPCVESLQYSIGPVVSTTEDLYAFTTTTCDQFSANSAAILILSACEIDDCYELLLWELLGEETPGRVVNGALDLGETVEWRFWLEAPPSELRLSSFGQLGDANDAWCFAGVTFELPVGGAVLTLSTTDNWLDAPCEAGTTYDGGCQEEYVFDLNNATSALTTPAPSNSLTAAPSVHVTEAAVSPAPTTTPTVAEGMSPAPTTSSRDMTTTSPPTPEEAEATTPAPATTTPGTDEDTEGSSPAPSTPAPAAADSADGVPAPTTDDDNTAEEDVSDQDTSSASGGYTPATAWMAPAMSAAIVTVCM